VAADVAVPGETALVVARAAVLSDDGVRKFAVGRVVITASMVSDPVVVFVVVSTVH
jgi:hypothetical protein